MSLFRKEALDHASRRLNGEVSLVAPVGLRVLVALLVGFVIAAVAFASFATFSRRESVSGWLTPEAGMTRLTARQGGQIEQIHVREGDIVAVGQPIATVRLSSALASGDAYGALERSLTIQSAAAEVRAQAAMLALAAEERDLDRRAASLAREVAEARRRVDIQRERVALAQAEVERARAIVERGFLPTRELEVRQSTALAAEQQLSEMVATVLSFERQIDEAEARRRAIPIDRAAAEADGRAAQGDLDQRRTQTETEASYVVLATVPGAVGALPVRQGDAVAPNASIAVITPEASDLQAELYVPSRAIGFIKPGLEVRLMYDAFPYQKFGAGHGRVASISSTALAPTEVFLPGLTLDEPVFRVRVALESDQVQAYGRAVPLRAGMRVSGNVLLDRRTLVEWILEPLYAAGRR